MIAALLDVEEFTSAVHDNIKRTERSQDYEMKLGHVLIIVRSRFWPIERYPEDVLRADDIFKCYWG